MIVHSDGTYSANEYYYDCETVLRRPCRCDPCYDWPCGCPGILEVNRPDRGVRHLRAKNETIDAETAARAVLSGAATAVPKVADGTVEMIRQIKIAKDTAVKARGQAIITLKTIIVTAPAQAPRGTRNHSVTQRSSGDCRKLRTNR
ncbi:MAG: hypothetical protein ABR608_00265 [Pseudonocardiaceae bacterium]